MSDKHRVQMLSFTEEGTKSVPYAGVIDKLDRSANDCLSLRTDRQYSLLRGRAATSERAQEPQTEGRSHDQQTLHRRRRRVRVAHCGARASEAQSMTVGDLQEFCTASDDGSKAACRFFIFGVAQGVRLAAAALGEKTHYCFPDDPLRSGNGTRSQASHRPRFDGLSNRSEFGGIRFRRSRSNKGVPL